MLSGLVHLVDVSLTLQSGDGDLGDVLPHRKHLYI
jgi:hypothetical protein